MSRLQPFVSAASACLVLLLGQACSRSSSTPTELQPEQGLRHVGSTTAGGEGDGLAATLLHATWPLVQGPVPEPALREQLRRVARDHLQYQALGSGSGASLMGSARIRRLAALNTAPADTNGKFGNLDETLQAELETLAKLAGAQVPLGALPILFPWSNGQADYAAAIDPADPGLGAPAAPALSGQVETAQLGQAMRARLFLVVDILLGGHNGQPGRTAEETALALFLLQQLLAAEESIYASLFMQGDVLSGLSDPRSYDPEQGLRWLPKSFRIPDDPLNPGVPLDSYGLLDRASSLAALASVLQVASELALVVGAQNLQPEIQKLFQGQASPGSSGSQSATQAATEAATVTWDGEIGVLLKGNCLPCHSGALPANGFSVDSYEQVLMGGNSTGPTSAFPIVVKGNHARSILWQALGGQTPVNSRMPLGGPYFSTAQRQLVADWIDQGLLKSEPKGPQPARLGLDLALVCFANLRAMHYSAEGALHHRHEGDRPSAFVDTAATGMALQAVVALLAAVPDLAEAKSLLVKSAGFAATRLTDTEGRAVAGYDLGSQKAQGRAGLLAQAQLTSALLLAGQCLADAQLLDRGKRLAENLMAEFLVPGEELFLTELERSAKRYSPELIAVVLDALRLAAAVGGIQTAGQVRDGFLRRLLPVLVYAELGGGEVLGDGIADTDKNGIPEPALAGGEFGRAPVLAGDLRHGPDAKLLGSAEPVTWSKHVQPLFRTACASCHLDGTSKSLGGGYRLDSLFLLRQPGQNNPGLPLLLPGDPEASLLYRKLADRKPPFGVQMPSGLPPLSAQGKALVHRWILEGASER